MRTQVLSLGTLSGWSLQTTGELIYEICRQVENHDDILLYISHCSVGVIFQYVVNVNKLIIM